jgi:LmbE family N-acetylglucosaminyl deacetylase
MEELRPQVVVTFGPDGVTGHPDHRAVSCFVTEILQSREDGTPRLFYHAVRLRDAARFADETGRTLLAVAQQHLTTRIRVSDEAVARGLQAIGQHRSQFPPERLDEIRRAFRETTREVWFRRVFPPPGPVRSVEASLFG